MEKMDTVKDHLKAHEYENDFAEGHSSPAANSPTDAGSIVSETSDVGKAPQVSLKEVTMDALRKMHSDTDDDFSNDCDNDMQPGESKAVMEGCASMHLNSNSLETIQTSLEDQLTPGFVHQQSTNAEPISKPNDWTSSMGNLGEGMEFPIDDIASIELLNILDSTKAPRGLYDQILTILRKHSKNGFDFCKAKGRDKFLIHLQNKLPCPTLKTAVVDGVSLSRFPFKEMLQDLIISQKENFHVYNDSNDSIPGCGSELWNTRWMKDTYDLMVTDPDSEILIPIILYMDKTGTDSYQRYSLEPVLFSIANLDNSSRQKDRAWRHMGFMGDTSHIEDSHKSLQFYHSCLAAILDELKKFQETPSDIYVWLNGKMKLMTPKTPVMIVMGDQLSQDTLCGRMKVNSGGACRVHRGCMCSYLQAANPDAKCMPVPMNHFRKIQAESNISQTEFDSIICSGANPGRVDAALAKGSTELRYLKRKKEMNMDLLSRPFTSHRLSSAFAGIHFGAWECGIFDATFDDFMHSAESGVLMSVGQTTFDGLQPKQRLEVEHKMQTLLKGIRSSVREDYPRWRIQNGFSRQTLMTSVERAGSLFSLMISLHDKSIGQVIQSGHRKQVDKYYTFTDPFEKKMFWEDYMTSYEEFCESNFEHTLEHMIRHGFDATLISSLDPLQIQQMFDNCKQLFVKVEYPVSYPPANIDDAYDDLGHNLIRSKQFKQYLKIIESKMKEEYTPRDSLIPISGIRRKHWFKKKPGIGSSAAIMAANDLSLTKTDLPMRSYCLFLEYILCYRQFCHDSATIPPKFLNSHSTVVDYGGRNLVRYLDKMIYRGDDTIDFRTTKVHAQIRTGLNLSRILNLEHTNCKTGERLLKTKAKQAAITAQQRPGEFEGQVAKRIIDRHTLDFATELHERFVERKKHMAEIDVNENPPETTVKNEDQFYRKHPNLIVYTNPIVAIYGVDNRGNKRALGNRCSSLPECVVDCMIRNHPEWTTFNVFHEVRLRNNRFSVKAYGNYRGNGPWHDYISVAMNQSNGEVINEEARALAFYCGEDGVNKYAIVQTSDIVKGNAYQDSLLVTHRKLRYIGNNGDLPALISVELETIERPLLAIPHRPPRDVLDAENNGFMCVRPRDEWPYVWIAWNYHLKRKNSGVTVKKSGVTVKKSGVTVKNRKKSVSKTAYTSLKDVETINATRRTLAQMLIDNLEEVDDTF